MFRGRLQTPNLDDYEAHLDLNRTPGASRGTHLGHLFRTMVHHFVRHFLGPGPGRPAGSQTAAGQLPKSFQGMRGEHFFDLIFYIHPKL